MVWKFWDYIGEYFFGTKTKDFYIQQRNFCQEFSRSKREMNREFRRLSMNKIASGALRGFSNLMALALTGIYATARIKGIKLDFPFEFLALTESARIYGMFYSYFWRKEEGLTNREILRDAFFEQAILEKEKQEDGEGEEWKNGRKKLD